MKSSRSSKAKSREEAAYDRRRWQQILDDLSNRPNLERAQAEAIVRKIVAVENATSEQKAELQQCLDARFGRLEPVVSQSSPIALALAPAARRLTQGVLDPEWLAVPPARRSRNRRDPLEESPPTAQPSIETQFRRLVLHIGLDAARAVMDDLSRLLTPL